jgi:hypothetical protein
MSTGPTSELEKGAWAGPGDHKQQSLLGSAESNIKKTPGVVAIRKGGGVTRHHHDVAAFEALGLMDGANSSVGWLSMSTETGPQICTE